MWHRVLVGMLAVGLVAAALTLHPGPASAVDASVSIGDNFFSPSSVSIDVGDTVTWTWTGSNMHSTTSDDGQADSWDSGTKSSGTFAHTFDTAGVFTYHCKVHASMKGTVTVGGASPSPSTSPSPTGTPTPSTPALAIADASARETAGSLVFAVSLSGTSSADVTVAYATSDGTATAGADYASTSGTLTIASGETGGTISVPVYPDLELESAETLTVTLSAPTGATIEDGTAVGTISNDPCTLRGDRRANTLLGTAGPDVLCGGGGDDTLQGGGGADVLKGGRGDDALEGGAGPDTLEGGGGADLLEGGGGADALDARDGVEGNDELRGGPGEDACRADRRDVRRSC
jgi:plastocyanin